MQNIKPFTKIVTSKEGAADLQVLISYAGRGKEWGIKDHEHIVSVTAAVNVADKPFTYDYQPQSLVLGAADEETAYKVVEGFDVKQAEQAVQQIKDSLKPEIKK